MSSLIKVGHYLCHLAYLHVTMSIAAELFLSSILTEDGVTLKAAAEKLEDDLDFRRWPVRCALDHLSLRHNGFLFLLLGTRELRRADRIGSMPARWRLR